jgi:uncharacterized protein (TIRG00374 family)
MSTPHPVPITRRLLPGVIFGIFVLLALGLAGDLRQVSKIVSQFNWGIFPFVLLLTLVNYILRFLKWHFYLHQVGVKNIPWPQSMRLFIAGFPLAVTPGKVGEALKGVWLNQMSNLPVGGGISVVVAERISDGLAVLALSTLGVIAYPQYWTAFFAILVILLIFVALTQVRPVALWFLNLVEKLPVLHRLTSGLREFYDGSSTLFRPFPTLLAVGLGTVSWLAEGIGFYLILMGLGLPPGARLLSLAVFILAFSTVIGAVSALPGGLGAAEISIAGMLSLLLPVGAAVASTATLLVRLATLWFGVSLGLIVWAFSPHLLGLNEKPQKESISNIT